MSEQRRRTAPKPGVLAAVLLMGLAVGLLVMLAVGLLAAALVVRGSLGMGQLAWAVLAALFLAALAGGLFASRKLEGMPLVWSLCVALEIAAVILICSGAANGAIAWGAAAVRVLSAVLGGVAAGVLSALRKK